MVKAMKQKKGKRGPTPLEATGELVHAENAPEMPPLVDLSTFTPDLLHNHEILQARVTTYRFEAWMYRLVARHGIPLDSALPALTLLVCFVECELVDRATNPAKYKRADDHDRYDEPDEEPGMDHVVADRLTISMAPPRRVKSDAVYPGCQGEVISGVTCDKFRAYGERFCPACRRKYLRMMREG